MRCAIRFDSVQPWIGRSVENRSASYGPFFTIQNLKPNMSRRSQHGKYSKLREDDRGKFKMEKRRRNDSLTGIMGSDRNTKTMGACVLLDLAFLALEPNLHSRGLERRGKDLSILWSRRIFDTPTFRCAGGEERSNLTNYWSWSEPHDISRDVTQ